MASSCLLTVHVAALDAHNYSAVGLQSRQLIAIVAPTVTFTQKVSKCVKNFKL